MSTSQASRGPDRTPSASTERTRAVAIPLRSPRDTHTGSGNRERRFSRMARRQPQWTNEDEEDGRDEDATSPLRRQREQEENVLQQALEAADTDNTAGAMTDEVFRRRSLSLMALLTKEVKKIGKEMKTIASHMEARKWSSTAQGTARGDKMLGKDARDVAWRLGQYETFYPSNGQLEEATVQHLGCSSLEDANLQHGPEAVANFRAKIQERMTKTVRGKTAADVKRIYLQQYAEEYPDILRKGSDGAPVMPMELKWNKVEELGEGLTYRIGRSGDYLKEPYGSTAFRNILAKTNADLGWAPRDWTPHDKIDWLGPAYIAFIDTLVEWLLKENRSIPKDQEPGHAKWKETYIQNLVEIKRQVRPTCQEVEPKMTADERPLQQGAARRT